MDYLLNNDWKIEPCHHSFVEFSIGEKEEESIYPIISNIGIIDPNGILPEKCLILRDKNQSIVKDEEFQFRVISYSREGNEIQKGGKRKRFQIQIKKEPNNENNENNEDHINFAWEIVDLNNGRYQVKMKIKDEGKYSIFVKYDGMNISSSPFQIQVFPTFTPRNYNGINQPKLIFGSQGKENGQFNNLNGITTDVNGSIYVCDGGNHRIQIFNSEGKFISTFECCGDRNVQLDFSYGMVVNSNGNIYVCDYGNHRIQIFDSEGKLILTFGSKGNGNGQFNNPNGIYIDVNGEIFVRDSYRIQIFDSEGKFISTFGSKGNGKGQFNNPNGITVNSKGNIIVCDDGNHRIQIFDSDGKFISTFGSYGSENGQFKNPQKICVDKKDNIYVLDKDNRIQIFDSEGKFILTFGSCGNENGQFNNPQEICVNSNGNIYVCDQIFNSDGKFISKFGSPISGNGQFNNPNEITVNSKGNIIVCDGAYNHNYRNYRVQIFDSVGKFISTFGSYGNGNGQFYDPNGVYVDLNDNILVSDHNNNRIQVFNSNGTYITQLKVNQPRDITIDPKTQNVIVCGKDNIVSIF